MKKLYFAIVALLLCAISASAVTAVTITSGTKLYLTPNANWKQSNARFAAYFFGNSGDAWVSMTKVDGETDLYEVTSPAGKNFTNVIFCRMNPSAAANNWNNRWNQTSDLTYDGTNNRYTVKAGTWDGGGGTWSVYNPQVITTQDPTFSEFDGIFGASFDLTIKSEAGATIYYSVDGSNPSIVYSAPITISETTTVKAYAVKDGAEKSAVVSSTYTKQSENLTDKVLYVTGDSWVSDNAWLAAYFFGAGETWMALNKVNDEHKGLAGYYQVAVPEGGYTSVIFCRMDGVSHTMNWTNKWNQTQDLTIGTANLCTLDAGLSKGTWSTIEKTAAPTFGTPAFQYDANYEIAFELELSGNGTIMYGAEDVWATYTTPITGNNDMTFEAYAYEVGKFNSDIVSYSVVCPQTTGYIYVNDLTGKGTLTLSAEGLIFAAEEIGSWNQNDLLTRSDVNFNKRFAYIISGEAQEMYVITYTWEDETTDTTEFHPLEEVKDGYVMFDADGNMTSVEGIEIENAPVEYFNLQGVRVANPENGLYIRRQGNKVEKIFLRK